MAMRRYLAVGFDMDSTLLRTDVDYQKICRTVCDGLISAGVPGDLLDAEENSKHNLSAGTEFLTGCGRSGEVAGIIEKIREDVKKVEMENMCAAMPYEGSEDMIGYLKEKGYKIGVLTRGSREYATGALTASGLIGMLDALVCRDDHSEEQAKPSPAAMGHLAEALGVGPGDILYLGDNKTDYFCARDSGAGFIGVLTRYTEYDWRSAGDGIEVIDTVADLIGIL